LPNRDSVPFNKRVILVRRFHTARPAASIENRIRIQKLLLLAHGLIKARLAGKEIAAQIEAGKTYLHNMENDHPNQRDNENNKPGKQRRHYSTRSGDSFASKLSQNL
jgi:hypothetical protein